LAFNIVIALSAVTLLLGFSQSKEYHEMEWPIDLLIVVLWVTFSINIVMTIFKRKEEQVYISLWFMMAALIGVAVLFVVNGISVPVTLFKSYSVFAGTNDANVQWWFGHNAVAMVLTVPALAVFYYFLPKSAGVPIYSHRLGIISFWSLIFMYLWTGAHHLLWTPIPDWVQTLAMAFSIFPLLVDHFGHQPGQSGGQSRLLPQRLALSSGRAGLAGGRPGWLAGVAGPGW